MRERPILFSAPMVRAILEGRKTQTRRVIKPTSREANGIGVYTEDGRGVVEVVNTYDCEPIDAPPIRCPYGAPGDRLWVRETHAFGPIVEDPDDWRDNPDDWETFYRADGDERDWQNHDGEPVRAPWRPSIFMPRWASRITLEVTGVRVERLRDISEADAKAEGVTVPYTDWTPRDAFASLWRDINGAESWDANPWVWVVEFRRVEAQERAA